MARVKFKDYQRLFVKPKKIYAGYCVIYYSKHSTGPIIKASIKKKVGKPHDRNYYKRRVKHILQKLPFCHNIFILAIILKPHSMTFENEKKFLVKKLHLLLNKNNVVSY